MSRRRFRQAFDAVRTNDEGVAAVELALLAPIFLLFLALLLDLGLAFSNKLRLVSATAAAAQFAFSNGQSLTASTVPAFLANVNSVATSAANITPAPTVTVKYNNVTDGSNFTNYYCISGTSSTTAIWTSTSTSSSSCGGNVMSGKFVTIILSATTTPLFYSNSLIGTMITEQDAAIVRVQ